MADIRLGRAASMGLLLLPLLVIAIVVGIATDWDWRGFIVPALFVLAVVFYLGRFRD